jgi:hypothetical protein
LVKKGLPKETEEEQFEIIKRMKKRRPDWQFDICPICNEWCVLLDGYNGMHPVCYAEHKTKRKKIPNRNQGTLI